MQKKNNFKSSCLNLTHFKQFVALILLIAKQVVMEFSSEVSKFKLSKIKMYFETNKKQSFVSVIVQNRKCIFSEACESNMATEILMCLTELTNKNNF